MLVDPAEISLFGYRSQFPSVADSGSLCIILFLFRIKECTVSSTELFCFCLFNQFSVLLFCLLNNKQNYRSNRSMKVF